MRKPLQICKWRENEPTRTPDEDVLKPDVASCYTTSITARTGKMKIVGDSRACSFHQIFCYMQCIRCGVCSLLHRRHFLRFKAVHCSFRNAGTYRFRRRLLLPTGLFIGCSVEGYEQHKIRTQSRASGESREFLPSACSNVWQRWPVGTGVIVVSGIINEAFL